MKPNLNKSVNHEIEPQFERRIDGFMVESDADIVCRLVAAWILKKLTLGEPTTNPSLTRHEPGPIFSCGGHKPKILSPKGQQNAT